MSTTHILVRWDREWEQAHPYEAAPNEAEDEPDAYEADVPADVWQAFNAACTAYTDAKAAVLKAAGFDESIGQMIDPCSAWEGYELPDSESWAVKVDIGQRYDLYIHSFDGADEARQHVASLPETFYLHHGRELVAVSRGRIEVEHQQREGYRSDCHRCGWDYAEHGGR
jgi:hypothetical protein